MQRAEYSQAYIIISCVDLYNQDTRISDQCKDLPHVTPALGIVINFSKQDFIRQNEILVLTAKPSTNDSEYSH